MPLSLLKNMDGIGIEVVNALELLAAFNRPIDGRSSNI